MIRPTSGVPSFRDILVGHELNVSSIPLKSGSSFNGYKALLFSDAEIKSLSEPLKCCLVDKFQWGRPSVDSIRMEVNSLGFKQEIFVGVLNNKCILLRCSNLEDYTKLFAKRQLFIKFFLMRIIKWCPDSDFSIESPIYPVWISLPQFRLHFMQKDILYAIGNMLGKTLDIDKLTLDMARPCVARILVEIDVSVDLEKEIWLGSEDKGYLQKIIYEKLPIYCKHCKLFGHHDDVCYTLNPSLRKRKNTVDGSEGIEQTSDHNDGNKEINSANGILDMDTGYGFCPPQQADLCIHRSITEL